MCMCIVCLDYNITIIMLTYVCQSAEGHLFTAVTLATSNHEDHPAHIHCFDGHFPRDWCWFSSSTWFQKTKTKSCRIIATALLWILPIEVIVLFCAVDRGWTKRVQEGGVPVWSYWDTSFNNVTTVLSPTPTNWINMNHFHPRSASFICALVNVVICFHFCFGLVGCVRLCLQ